MIHGGDIYTVAKLLNKKPSEIIDLSSSVNPLPLPTEIKEKIIEKIDFLNRYPDIQARAFKEKLAQDSVPFENIICGNGSTELIYLIVKAFSAKSVLILEPTFIEYERACRLNNVTYVEKLFSLNPDELMATAKKTLKNKKFDLVFICNPNNPTGWLIKREEILNLINTIKNTVFVIDEAFIDFSPEDTLIYEAVTKENILILRSLTKFYGLAGLRFGYAVGNKKLIEKLKHFAQPWSINSLAQIAAEEIIKHEEFKKQSYEFFKKEKEFFETSLKDMNLDCFPSVANFYLIKLPHEGFAKEILKKGILVRDCSNFFGLDGRFIRVSLKTRKENENFLRELQKWLKDL